MEEKWNTYSHAFGFLLAAVGLLVLNNQTVSKVLYLPVLLYSLSLVMLFFASTWYHSTSDSELKRKLRVLDHVCIYFLIAGTYTPVCVAYLMDSKGALLLFLVWGMAFFGTLLKLFFLGRFPVFSLVLYACMGWLIAFDWTYLETKASPQVLFYLILGGFFYTIGIIFYAVKRIPFNHFIWHLFVICGALSHWIMVYHVIQMSYAT